MDRTQSRFREYQDVSQVSNIGVKRPRSAGIDGGMAALRGRTKLDSSVVYTVVYGDYDTNLLSVLAHCACDRTLLWFACGWGLMQRIPHG